MVVELFDSRLSAAGGNLASQRSEYMATNSMWRWHAIWRMSRRSLSRDFQEGDGIPFCWFSEYCDRGWQGIEKNQERRLQAILTNSRYAEVYKSWNLKKWYLWILYSSLLLQKLFLLLMKMKSHNKTHSRSHKLWATFQVPPEINKKPIKLKKYNHIIDLCLKPLCKISNYASTILSLHNTTDKLLSLN